MEVPTECKHGISLRVHCCQCNSEIIAGVHEYLQHQQQIKSSVCNDGNGIDEDEEG